MRVFWLTICLVFLSACSAVEKLPSPPIPSQSVTPTSTDTYEVKAWVDKTDPILGQDMLLSGSLIKNGVYLNGIMMSGYWQKPGEDAPTQHCYELVLYQRGKCNIIVEGFPDGIFVPLKIEIKYNGMSFTAETGFTPHSK